MPAGPCCPPFDTIARKWCSLAERRRDYFIELYNSGRWARYYTKEAFAVRMRDVLAVTKVWRQLAGVQDTASSEPRAAA
ncbi:MAG TPA: TIGR03809 family protein [Pseudolabrys sp.]|jgi:uncharacterized repeat protein (TIGR03809 family)|nr:TIGR03809 family protein [Pseudolabrys sp.]